MVILKLPLTYSEQIERLKNFHNLIIDDNDEAIRILKSVNYYRLSGYGIGLTIQNNKDKYQEGISLRGLYDLYCFDSLLKKYFFNIIEQIEISLRTQIAYRIALTYGADGFYSSLNFIDKKNGKKESIHETIIKSFNKEVERQKELPFVKHHLGKYEGLFPVWVAVELFSFGMLSSLFSIMKTQDRKAIASYYKCSHLNLGTWIQALVEIRNICAHYGRLYNLPLRHTIPLQKDELYNYQQRQNKIFPIILVIKKICSTNGQWDNFYSELKELMHKYKHVIRLSYMGFPNNWEEILDKEISD